MVPGETPVIIEWVYGDDGRWAVRGTTADGSTCILALGDNDGPAFKIALGDPT